MNALRFLARLAVLVAFVPFVWALWFYDQAREARLKRALGTHYEGPLDNKDLS